MTWDEYHKIQEEWVPKVGDPVRIKDFTYGPSSWIEGFTGVITEVNDCFDSVWKHYPKVKGLTIRLDKMWTSGGVEVNGKIPIKVGKLDSVNVRLNTPEIREFLHTPKDEHEKMAYCKFHKQIDNYTDRCSAHDMDFDIDDNPLWETCKNCKEWRNKYGKS